MTHSYLDSEHRKQSRFPLTLKSSRRYDREDEPTDRSVCRVSGFPSISGRIPPHNAHGEFSSPGASE